MHNVRRKENETNSKYIIDTLIKPASYRLVILPCKAQKSTNNHATVCDVLVAFSAIVLAHALKYGLLDLQPLERKRGWAVAQEGKYHAKDVGAINNRKLMMSD